MKVEKNIYFHQTRQTLEVFITEATFKGWISKQTAISLRFFLENVQTQITTLTSICDSVNNEIHKWEETNNFGWIKRNIIARSPLFWFHWLIQRNRFKKFVETSKKLFKKSSFFQLPPTGLRSSGEFIIPTLTILKPSLEALARINELGKVLYHAESILGYILYQVDILTEIIFFIQMKNNKTAESLLRYFLIKSIEIQNIIYFSNEESDWPNPLIPFPDFLYINNGKIDIKEDDQENNIKINNEINNENNKEKEGESSLAFHHQFAEKFSKLTKEQNLFLIRVKKTVSISGFHHSNWIPYSIISMILLTGGGVVYYHGTHVIYDYVRDTFRQWSNASFRFYKEHFEEPISKIYRTIRYDENSLQITDPNAILLEVETLGTMVREYVIDNDPSLPVDDLIARKEILQKVTAEAKNGNLSRILEDYAQTLKHPIREALRGELIRLVLIQVQKMKVDAENMVGVMDQLLRANELNFQALALMPALLFISFFTYQTFAILTRKPSKKNGFINLRTELRKIDVTLNKYLSSSPSDNRLEENSLVNINTNYTNKTTSCSDKGKIMVAVLKVQNLTSILPSNQQLLFFEDTNQLLDKQLNPTQKMSVVARIFNVFINNTVK